MSFVKPHHLNERADCIDMLKMLAQACSGIQRKFYQQMLNDAKEVQCVSIYDAFEPDEIEVIERLHPQKKQCYQNAYRLTSMFPDKVIYCEGQLDYNGLGIDHAFNKVGDLYVDITSELALENDVEANDYLVFGEYGYYDVMRTQAKNGFYGDIYNTKLREKFGNK